jgi:RNA polymerase sigma-70 factor (ECF subfamily)
MMKAAPLENLFEELCRGDPKALEQAFVAYEPYLRMVVRRQLPKKLRAKFDSVDVVQSIWVDVLQGARAGGWRFDDVAHLKAFLVKVTRNRFIDRVRQHGRRMFHEYSLPPGDLESLAGARQPQPGEELQAVELWEQLLALCPPAHHTLLKLKRQGLSLAEIAERTGLHQSSVRRILYELARRLGKEQKKAAPGPKIAPRG